MEGWIKIHRKILENPIVCKDSDYLAVWIYLLLNATHKEYDTLFKGKRTTLQKGQLITGRKVIAKKLKINESKVQNILNSFENEQQIKQQMSNKNRLVTIIHWAEYQNFEQQNTQQLNNNQTTDEQQVNTNNNDKNIKNDKNVTTTVSDSCVDGLPKVNDSCVNDLQAVVDFYNNNIGMITPYGIELLEDYTKEMQYDLIILAMKKAVEADRRTIQYIKGILNNWTKKGIKTVIDAEKEDEQFRNKSIQHEETEEEKIARKIKELEG